MGAISDLFRSTYRRYVTDGVPSSGAWSPPKSDIVEIGDLLDASISAAIIGRHDIAPVRILMTTNVVIASALENGDTLDGLTLATNDRIALTGQSTGSQNGIYVVQASGAAVRATDSDSDTDLTGGTFYVTAGTNKSKTYTCATPLPITVGSTTLSYVLTNDLDQAAIDSAVAAKANIASPTFTGTPAAPTPSTADDSTKIATTAHVRANVAAEAVARDAAIGVESAARIAADLLKAPLESPTLTGTPVAPTPLPGTDTTQLATTAYVRGDIVALERTNEIVHYIGPNEVSGLLRKTIYDQIQFMRATIGRTATATSIWDCLRRFHLFAATESGSFCNWKDPSGTYMTLYGEVGNELAFHPGMGWHAAPSNDDTAYLEFANPASLSGVGQNDYAWGISIFSGEFSSSGVMFQAGATDVIGSNVLSFQAQLNTSPGSFGTKMMAGSVNSSTTIAGESAVGYTGCSRIASGSYTAARNGSAETETRTSTGVPDGTLRMLGGYEGGVSLWFDGLGMDAAIIEDTMHDVVGALVGKV